MAGIFHRSIWPRWRIWSGQIESKELQTALARHLVSHLHAGLLQATGGTVHPEEWYFLPVLSSAPISTGDLIALEENQVSVVVTPRCDLARTGVDRCKTIQLARCIDVSAEWVRAEQNENVKKGNEEKADMRQHRKKPVQHFLPRMQLSDTEKKGPWFARFDQIVSMENNDQLLERLRAQRLAAVTSEYVPSLVERLGAYFSRIGTPDIS